MSTHQTITGAEIGLLSYLFEAVGDLLTPEQRQELSDQLTSLRPAGVAPGDLITAELFNAVVNNVNDLLARVAVLEGAEGGPIIESIEPIGVDKEIGSRVTIFGRNFRPDDPETFISFGSIPVSDFLLESDAFHLVTQVPIGFPALPSTVNVTVTSNGKRSNSLPITIVGPIVIPEGEVIVRNLETPLGEIEGEETYTLGWRLINNRNVAVRLDLTPRISEIDGSNAAEWASNVSLSRANPVDMEPGDRIDLTMTVEVPDDAVSALVGLDATDNFGVRWQGKATGFIVGEVPQSSDLRAVMRVPDFLNTATLRKAIMPLDGISTPGFRVSRNVTVNLPMEIGTTAEGAGFYQISVEVQPGTPAGGGGPQNGRWIIGALGPRIEVAASQIMPFFIPVTSSDIAETQTISALRITARRFATNTSPTATFTSFIGVPIAGKA